VIAGIVVTLTFLSLPVCLPVLAVLVVKDTTSASRLWLARRMVEALARTLPERRIEVVADAAYAGGELRGLDLRISWTTRLRRDAVLYEPAPPRQQPAVRLPLRCGGPCRARPSACGDQDKVSVSSAVVHRAPSENEQRCDNWPAVVRAPEDYVKSRSCEARRVVF
jgi:hypothetical protein